MDQKQVQQLLQSTSLFNEVVKSSSPILKSRGLDFGFIVSDSIEGRDTEILIGFEDSFPLNPPSFFINNYDTYEHIPHADPDGKICYSHEDYLFLDITRPAEVILELYGIVKATIALGLKQENRIDFTNEYESYWGKIKGAEALFCNVDISSEPCIIKVGTLDNFKIVVSENNDSLQSIRRFLHIKDSGLNYKNGTYIPLIPAQPLIPPRYNESIGIDFIKTLVIDNTTPEVRKKIEKIISKCRSSGIVIFSFQLPYGNSALFGVRFTKTASEDHPLSIQNYTGKILPLQLQRLDREYLYRRGGSGEKTQSKRGLVIGCGSVGGFIIEELVRNGFMNLTIADGDTLTLENCYRHLLGFTAIGKNKAKAVKEKIERYFPHSQVEAGEDAIEALIAKNKLDLNNFDFIVVATGNVTVNCYLNDLLYKQFQGKPTFFAWNEPYGIGGHCLITNTTGKGCYHCLYKENNSFNSASFADKNQPKTFLKTVSGCGSIYTPYGAIASQRTSLLTVTKLIEIVKSNDPRNSIFSWKGDCDIFLKEGYSLSPRFLMTEDELIATKNEFAHPECLICNHEN